MKRKMFTNSFYLLLVILEITIFNLDSYSADRYWIGGGNGNFNDGTHWASNTGGAALGGTISWTSSDRAYFDGNSGVVGTVFLNNNYTAGSIYLSGTQTVTLESSGGSFTLTITGGVITGNSGTTLVISSNTTLSTSTAINGGSTSTFIYNVVINGTLQTSNYLNSSYLTVGINGLLKTSYANTNTSGGWWNGGNSPILNYITLNGTVEFSGNNQSIPGLGYNNLKFSGSTSGTANLLRGNVTVLNELNVVSGKINLNSKDLTFQGTTFTNNGSILSPGLIKFRTNAGNTAQTLTGTGTIAATNVEVASTNNINMTSSITLTVSEFLFSNQGSFNNSTSLLTIGTGGACTLTFDDGGSDVSTGNFSNTPIYNGTLSINYNSQSGTKLSGIETPATFANVSVSNPNGVVLNDDIIITGSILIDNPGSGGVLNLSNSSITFQGTSFTNMGTITGSNSGTIIFTKNDSQTLDISGSISTHIPTIVIDNTNLLILGSSGENLVTDNVYFNNSGNLLTSSSQITIGSGGSALIEFNNLHAGNCGNFVSQPVFNISNSGTNGLTINYKTELNGRTIGIEMPPTGANMYISNTHGIIDNGNYQLSGNLDIDAGYLYINPNKSITVEGVTTNNVGTSGLIISSDATGTGSLMHNTANVNATVQRFISGSSNLGAKKYHLVSVPINSTTYLSGVWLDSYLFTYIETTNGWYIWDDPTNNVLQTKQGAMVFYPNWDATTSKTYNITGQLNNGTYSPTVTYGGSGFGFNLVPNPYPSAIDWNAASGWTKTNISGTIWGFNSSIGSYGSWNGTTGTNSVGRYIPVGQAFFVQATGSPTLTMTNSVRLHNTSDFLKSGELVPNILHLIASGNGGQDEIAVQFAYDATETSLDCYDAAKFYSDMQVPQLSTYTSVDNTALSITGLPNSENSSIVPLRFEMDYTGEITFSASAVESFNNSTSIKLEDKQLSQLIDLRTTPNYTFTHTPGDANDRFVLHFGSVLGTGDEQAELAGRVTVSGNQIYVEYPSSASKQLKAVIYDSQGRAISQFKLNGSGQENVTIPSSGVYFVKLWLDGGVETHKIVVL